MPEPLDHLAHLEHESARFAAVLRATDPAVPVPSCPEWTAADLWAHLAGVQWFWGTILESGALTDADAAAVRERRAALDPADVPAFYDEASARLVALLDDADPHAPAWTWADDRTVGFILRRQAHEALIHRVDAELAAGARTPLPPALAADGTDEVLRVMHGLPASWGRFEPLAGAPVRLRATDTGSTWLAAVGRLVGTAPDGEVVDEACLDVEDADDGSPAAAEISAAAGDLDVWLWNRAPMGEVQRVGDPEVLGAFERVRTAGVG